MTEQIMGKESGKLWKSQIIYPFSRFIGLFLTYWPLWSQPNDTVWMWIYAKSNLEVLKNIYYIYNCRRSALIELKSVKTAVLEVSGVMTSLYDVIDQNFTFP